MGRTDFDNLLEISEDVFSFLVERLNVLTLARLSLVSREFHRRLNSPYLWETLYFRRFGMPGEDDLIGVFGTDGTVVQLNWKQMFMSRCRCGICGLFHLRSLKCHRCHLMFCPKCSTHRNCSKCRLNICARCKLPQEETQPYQCPSCGMADTCRFRRVCAGCRAECCEDCVATCQRPKCGRVMCQRCRLRNCRCGRRLCARCFRTHHVKCPQCKKFFCLPLDIPLEPPPVEIKYSNANVNTNAKAKHTRATRGGSRNARNSRSPPPSQRRLEGFFQQDFKCRGCYNLHCLACMQKPCLVCGKPRTCQRCTTECPICTLRMCSDCARAHVCLCSLCQRIIVQDAPQPHETHTNTSTPTPTPAPTTTTPPRAEAPSDREATLEPTSPKTEAQAADTRAATEPTCEATPETEAHVAQVPVPVPVPVPAAPTEEATEAEVKEGERKHDDQDDDEEEEEEDPRAKAPALKCRACHRVACRRCVCKGRLSPCHKCSGYFCEQCLTRSMCGLSLCMRCYRAHTQRCNQCPPLLPGGGKARRCVR